MKHALIAIALASMLAAPAVPQGVGHTWLMRGSVVDVTDKVATLCIGRADGAAPGQVLDVVRVTGVPGPQKTQAFRRDKVGEVRVDDIIDEHFARATLAKGEVAKHDIVELRRP